MSEGLNSPGYRGRTGRRSLLEEVALWANDPLDKTIPRRRGLIPEPVEFPESINPRNTRNSSRGRSAPSSSRQLNITDANSDQEEPLPFRDGLDSPSNELPEDILEQTIGNSNSPASQRPNPVPINQGQQNTVSVNTTQNPSVQTVVPQQNASSVAPQLKKMDHSKLPLTYGKNALKFEGDPEDLPSYLTAIEDVITKTGATLDSEKKWIAIHYCVQSVKNQWKALVAAADGFTWNEFVDEIKESYPEYKELERGSIAALDRFVNQTAKRPIKLDDYKSLRAYIRQIRAMIKQLTEPTERITNREAAKAFLGGLTGELKVLVKNMMLNAPRETLGSYIRAKEAWEKANPNTKYTPPPIDKDDKYDWTDLVDAASRICEDESSSFFGEPAEKKKVTMLVQDVEVEPAVIKNLASRMEKIETNLASQTETSRQLKDQLQKAVGDKVEEAMASHMDKFSADQHREMQQLKTMLESGQSRGPSQHTREYNNYGHNQQQSYMRGNDRPGRDGCFYCWKPGHFIDNCEDRKSDLITGILKLVGGKMHLFDGKLIPREPPHKSPFDKAHDYYSNRAVGSQNYEELMDQYFGSEPGPSSYSNNASWGEDTQQGIMDKIARLESMIQTRRGGPAGDRTDFP